MSTARSGGLRVVLDTNVYISAFTNRRGQTFLIWNAASDRRYHLLTSPAIVREMAGVLRERFSWNEEDVAHHVRLVAKVAEIITPKVTLNIIMEDPPDNRILECAVEGRADLIVSGDRHLRRLKVYQDIPIVRPVDLLRTLGVAVKTKR
jgi:putative PIN family toxin of toxin-antitoxin system